MKEGRIVRRSLGDPRRGKTDWARVDALTDADIERAIAEDPDAVPILDAEFWKNAVLVPPPVRKSAVSLRLDADVLDFFRAAGRGYQTRINSVLRSFVAQARRIKTAATAKPKKTRRARR
jgi:uncharacterized protein (DUF4415 family)